MNPKIRLAIFAVSGCALFAMFAAGLSRLHPVGYAEGPPRRTANSSTQSQCPRDRSRTL